jgi:arginine decarboxylase-like protein
MIRSRLHQKNPLQVPIESITRLRVKNLKNAFNRLISYFEYLGQGEFQTGYIFKK